jgi:hypothetical protein
LKNETNKFLEVKKMAGSQKEKTSFETEDDMESLIIEKICEDMQWGGEV